MNALLISVRLHEGWYHGSGGVPSPARMFQALVAGAGCIGVLERGALNKQVAADSQDAAIAPIPQFHASADTIASAVRCIACAYTQPRPGFDCPTAIWW